MAFYENAFDDKLVRFLHRNAQQTVNGGVAYSLLIDDKPGHHASATHLQERVVSPS